MNKAVKAYMADAIVELGETRMDRKTFMIWCSDNIPKAYRGYVVAMYNKKPINFLTKQTNGYKKLNELIIEKEVE
jgi:hypothetical protein